MNQSVSHQVHVDTFKNKHETISTTTRKKSERDLDASNSASVQNVYCGAARCAVSAVMSFRTNERRKKSLVH